MAEKMTLQTRKLNSLEGTKESSIVTTVIISYQTRYFIKIKSLMCLCRNQSVNQMFLQSFNTTTWVPSSSYNRVVLLIPSNVLLLVVITLVYLMVQVTKGKEVEQTLSHKMSQYLRVNLLLHLQFLVYVFQFYKIRWSNDFFITCM
jgi:hypothetical protein